MSPLVSFHNPFFGSQLGTSLHCMRDNEYKEGKGRGGEGVVCLFTPQISPVLILPNPEGWPGWADLVGWSNTKVMRTRLESAKGTHTIQ